MICMYTSCMTHICVYIHACIYVCSVCRAFDQLTTSWNLRLFKVSWVRPMWLGCTWIRDYVIWMYTWIRDVHMCAHIGYFTSLPQVGSCQVEGLLCRSDVICIYIYMNTWVCSIYLYISCDIYMCVYIGHLTRWPQVESNIREGLFVGLTWYMYIHIYVITRYIYTHLPWDIIICLYWAFDYGVARISRLGP